MTKYLCIDPGLSHSGIAISDSTKLVQPLTTIHEKNSKKMLVRILSIINEQNPNQVIIGQPLFGPINKIAQELFIAIKQQFNGEIVLFPEDLSSKIASRKLIQSGSSKQTRRHRQHTVAAAIILQDFLESLIIW